MLNNVIDNITRNQRDSPESSKDNCQSSTPDNPVHEASSVPSMDVAPLQTWPDGTHAMRMGDQLGLFSDDGCFCGWI